MELFKLIQRLDEDLPSRLYRLLIIIYELSNGYKKDGIESIYTLARFDYLIKNPLLLTKIVKESVITTKLKLKRYERHSIESGLYLYRYNPWDDSYKSLINILISKGYIKMHNSADGYRIKVTELGDSVIDDIYSLECFQEYKTRAKLINTYLGKYGDNHLMSLLPRVFQQLNNPKL